MQIPLHKVKLVNHLVSSQRNNSCCLTSVQHLILWIIPLCCPSSVIQSQSPSNQHPHGSTPISLTAPRNTLQHPVRQPHCYNNHIRHCVLTHTNPAQQMYIRTRYLGHFAVLIIRLIISHAALLRALKIISYQHCS